MTCETSRKLHADQASYFGMSTIPARRLSEGTWQNSDNSTRAAQPGTVTNL